MPFERHPALDTASAVAPHEVSPEAKRSGRVAGRPKKLRPSVRPIELGRTDDHAEREAERVAMGASFQPSRGSTTSGSGSAPPIVHEVVASQGRPPATSRRAYFEERVGIDLAKVSLHDDSRAAQSADSIGARAYAVGNHIVLGNGSEPPGTSDGDRLLVHELVHVAQDRAPGGTNGRMLRRAPKTPTPQQPPQDGWLIHPEAMGLLEQKLRELYEAIPRKDRIALKADGTVAIGMVRQGGGVRLVYTVNGNGGSTKFHADAERLGLFRWTYNSGVKGRGNVGAPNDAEQLMEGFAVDNELTLYGMVVSRAPCADCAEVIHAYGGGRLRVEHIRDPADLPNPRQPLAPMKPAARMAGGEVSGSVFAQKPPTEMFGGERSMLETEPSVVVEQGAQPAQVSGELSGESVFAKERPIFEIEPPIIATDPALRGQVTKGTETTHVESGTGIASGVIAPQPPTQFSTGTRAAAGVLGVLTVASEIMGSIAPVQDVQRSYNARMEATVRFFDEFGGKPQSVMEDVDTHVQQPSGTKSDTGAVYGRWVAPRLESVNVQALLAALPGRLTTMQSLVEFLGTGRVLQVIEQRGAHYYLTGKGVGYVEITETIERIRSNLMRGLDERSRAQAASKGGAGVYRIRSSDVTIYRYAKGVREPWRVRHIGVPIITTQEFSGANMWVREVGDKGDRVHVEPANAEAEGLAQNAWYIVPKAVGDVYDEVESSGRTIKSRQPPDGPLEGFIAAPLPPELGYTRYLKHPNPDWREFTIAIGDLRQFWVDRDDLEPVSADQVAEYGRGTPAAPPASHFFRSEDRRDLPGS